MKYALWLMFLAISLTAISQNTQVAPSKSTIQVNWDQIEVRDSSGIIYPEIIWKKMMTTGKYQLLLSADKKSGLLVPLTQEEKNARESHFSKPTESKFFKTGEKLHSFSERDMHGTKYQLKQLIGKVVVLNFWFINCPPCRQEIPDLNDMVDSYKDNKDVVFIAIALDQRYDLEQFLKTSPYHYNIIDNGRYIASQYGVTLYPTHVVIDRTGKVLFHTSGLSGGTIPWLKKSIASALAASAVQQ